MRRSEINKSIDGAIAFFKRMNFNIPAWALRSPEQWRDAKEDASEIFDTRIGWDVTDFGSGELLKVGRTIFTLRNGSARMKERYPKSYAHKAMYMLEGQKSPIHFHKSKREDIRNHAGGIVAIKLWRASAGNALSEEGFTISVDGLRRPFKAGEELHLAPGESVCVEPRTYHQFWALEGHGTTLTVEVSSTCDDLDDNFWLDKRERFPAIVEDEPARYALCGEYGTLRKA